MRAALFPETCKQLQVDLQDAIVKPASNSQGRLPKEAFNQVGFWYMAEHRIVFYHCFKGQPFCWGPARGALCGTGGHEVRLATDKGLAA